MRAVLVEKLGALEDIRLGETAKPALDTTTATASEEAVWTYIAREDLAALLHSAWASTDTHPGGAVATAPTSLRTRVAQAARAMSV